MYACIFFYDFVLLSFVLVMSEYVISILHLVLVVCVCVCVCACVSVCVPVSMFCVCVCPVLVIIHLVVLWFCLSWLTIP